MAREDGRRLYSAIGDPGRHLATRATCPDAAPARRPEDATFVLGGTRGYAPYIADAIACFVRDGGSGAVQRVAFGPPQQHASHIASNLRLRTTTRTSGTLAH